MKNHYIPQLILRQFAENGKVNSFSVATASCETRKIKKTFLEDDIFPNELEKKFAQKLEGPFGDLLNHKLLVDADNITINRQENLLIRKFEMINRMRSPYTNMPNDDFMSMAQEGNNFAYNLLKDVFQRADFLPSDKTYINDLMAAMEYDSPEQILEHKDELSPSLMMAALLAYTSYFEIWDSKKSEQEFILAKMPGIGLQDQYGFLHKTTFMMKYYEENKRKISFIQEQRFWSIFNGTVGNIDNYWICPLSPTRALVGISPFFKGFFPQKRNSIDTPYIPKLFREKDFNSHFYEPMRLELFEPCNCFRNMSYTYKVHDLTAHEVQFQNSLVLNEEIEEFVFHDYEKIKDSFWAYENLFKMVKKKHDYSMLL